MSYFVCPHCGERTNVFGEGGGREAARTLGVPLLGEIPLTPALREGGDDGTPIVVSQPDSPAGEALLQTARELAKASRTMVRKPLKLMTPGSPDGGNGHAHGDHAGHDHAGHDHGHAH